MENVTPHPLALTVQSKIKLAAFQADIQAAVDSAFDPHPTVYKKVIVQIIRFLNHDIPGAADLMEQLRSFLKNTYNYDVRHDSISGAKCTASQEVSNLLSEAGKECTDKGSLLIVVYSGHGQVKVSPRGESYLHIA